MLFVEGEWFWYSCEEMYVEGDLEFGIFECKLNEFCIWCKLEGEIKIVDGSGVIYI